MIDLSKVQHFHATEDICNVIQGRIGKDDRSFVQAVCAYYFGVIAGSMRAIVNSKTHKNMPVNVYSIALATSGYGKGHSVSIFENEIVDRFRLRFRDDTFETSMEKNLWKIANVRAAMNGSGQQEEYDALVRDVKSLGPFAPVFDAGSSPAIKQQRIKQLYAGAGSLNLKVDEIGQHIEGSAEAFGVFLELFDLGLTEGKLTKNTKDNMNLKQVDGYSPANMLLFGTPDDVFDSGKSEERFMSLLKTGFARRCIFGEGHDVAPSLTEITMEEAAAAYHLKAQSVQSPVLQQWSKHFHDLADVGRLGWSMDMDDDAGETLTYYEMFNKAEAAKLGSHQVMHKAEMSHRHTKALKLAGAYAFIDMSPTISLDDHLLPAILLVEESGQSFTKMLDREANWEKLAKYIAQAGKSLTHPEIMVDNPFYKQSQTQRSEMMNNAIAWGYKNHIIIKKTFEDGIEQFTGETLERTDLSNVLVAYSDNFAYEFGRETVPFDQLHLLTQADGMHWTNHAFEGQHRCEEKVIPGFNLVVLDIDGTARLEVVHQLLSDYRFLTYTTKRHTDEEHRFRLIIPINYQLKLDAENYKEFMNSLMDWLPFACDEASNQRSKKWMTNPTGQFHYNDGQLLDALPFIPKTSRNDEHKNSMKTLGSLDNLERWFAQRIASGNRNNQMIKFALALADSGMDFVEVQSRVHDFNKKLSNPLPKDEIESTIMVTVAKAYRKAA